MIYEDDLLYKLNQDINLLERKIDNYKLYNMRNTIIQMLIKAGIAIDYAMPFILSSIIIFNGLKLINNSPFQLEESKIFANTKTINTSTGMKIEYISYDYTYLDKYIEYSTGWIINKDGLYERTITKYQKNKKMKSLSKKEILSMSKEDLENIIDILEIKTVYKSYLEPEDYIYNKDAIIIYDYQKSDSEYKIKNESKDENFIDWVLYLGFTGLLGCSLKDLRIFKCINNKLKYLGSSFELLDEESCTKLKKIVEIKKENIKLLTDSTDKKLTYKLRR